MSLQAASPRDVECAKVGLRPARKISQESYIDIILIHTPFETDVRHKLHTRLFDMRAEVVLRLVLP